MNANLEKVKAMFLDAIEKQSPGEWGPYLDDACAGDQDLRQQVEVLLEAHASGESLLDKGAIAGPHVATVYGEDGTMATETHDNSLFPPYAIRVEISTTGEQLALDIPVQTP